MMGCVFLRSGWLHGAEWIGGGENRGESGATTVGVQGGAVGVQKG